MCAAVLAAFEKRAEALGTRFVRVPDRCWALETELILIVAVVVVLFGFYLMSTRIGLAMRAVHDDDAVANLMGVNTRAIQIGAFTLGGL